MLKNLLGVRILRIFRIHYKEGKEVYYQRPFQYMDDNECSLKPELQYFFELFFKVLKYLEILTGYFFLVSLKITSQILEKTKLHFLRILYYTPLRILGKFFLHLTTDYRRPVDKSLSLHGQKSTPTPKIMYTAKAYFVCHIGPNFQFSLIYVFIGCPWCVHLTDMGTLVF